MGSGGRRPLDFIRELWAIIGGFGRRSDTVGLTSRKAASELPVEEGSPRPLTQLGSAPLTPGGVPSEEGRGLRPGLGCCGDLGPIVLEFLWAGRKG